MQILAMPYQIAAAFALDHVLGYVRVVGQLMSMTGVAIAGTYVSSLLHLFIQDCSNRAPGGELCDIAFVCKVSAHF